MFVRQVHNDVTLSVSIPQYADELFALTGQNRDFLKQWLPWLDTVTTFSDTTDFIRAQLARFQPGEGLHVTIFYRDRIAGVLGYNRIDQANAIGHLGYWLAQESNGKGIMIASVRDLVDLGFHYYALHRIDIRCAVDNRTSRAIHERLGFQQEGLIRRAEQVQGQYLDHVVYGSKATVDFRSSGWATTGRIDRSYPEGPGRGCSPRSAGARPPSGRKHGGGSRVRPQRRVVPS